MDHRRREKSNIKIMNHKLRTITGRKFHSVNSLKYRSHSLWREGNYLFVISQYSHSKHTVFRRGFAVVRRGFAPGFAMVRRFQEGRTANGERRIKKAKPPSLAWTTQAMQKICISLPSTSKCIEEDSPDLQTRRKS